MSCTKVKVTIHGYVQWFAVCPPIQVDYNMQWVASVERNAIVTIEVPPEGMLLFRCMGRKCSIPMQQHDFHVYLSFSRATGSLKATIDTPQNMAQTIDSEKTSPQDSQELIQFKNSLGNREMISGIIWVCVGAYQIAISFFAFWYLLFLGIWNIVMGILSINRKKDILEKSGTAIYNAYAGTPTSIIIALIINLLVGGIIGVAGAIYDLMVRDYVVKHAYLLKR